MKLAEMHLETGPDDLDFEVFRGSTPDGLEMIVYKSFNAQTAQIFPVIWVPKWKQWVGSDSPNAKEVPGLMTAFGKVLNQRAAWDSYVTQLELDIWQDLRGDKKWRVELHDKDGKQIGETVIVDTRAAAARVSRTHWLKDIATQLKVKLNEALKKTPNHVYEHPDGHLRVRVAKDEEGTLIGYVVRKDMDLSPDDIDWANEVFHLYGNGVGDIIETDKKLTNLDTDWSDWYQDTVVIEGPLDLKSLHDDFDTE